MGHKRALSQQRGNRLSALLHPPVRALFRLACPLTHSGLLEPWLARPESVAGWFSSEMLREEQEKSPACLYLVTVPSMVGCWPVCWPVWGDCLGRDLETPFESACVTAPRGAG